MKNIIVLEGDNAEVTDEFSKNVLEMFHFSKTRSDDCYLYQQGAIDQCFDDVEFFCNWLSKHAVKYGVDPTMIVEDFKATMNSEHYED